MASEAEDCPALGEAVVFLSYFEDLPDVRQAGKVMYPLDEVLLLCLLAVLAGAETITDIARFGDKKLDLLRRFRPFAAGTPAHDHLGDILATLDAEQFQRCFVAWVASLIGVPEHPPDRRQDRARDPLLHHLADAPGRPRRRLRPRSLGGGEQPALDHGHGLPRRRMSPANRKRAGQLHHAQAHRPQPHPQSQEQGLHTIEAQIRLMLRKLCQKTS